jgi:hypothetical protein
VLHPVIAKALAQARRREFEEQASRWRFRRAARLHHKTLPTDSSMRTEGSRSVADQNSVRSVGEGLPPEMLPSSDDAFVNAATPAGGRGRPQIQTLTQVTGDFSEASAVIVATLRVAVIDELVSPWAPWNHASTALSQPRGRMG